MSDRDVGASRRDASTVPGRRGHLEFQNFEIRQKFFLSKKYNEFEDWREIWLRLSKRKGWNMKVVRKDDIRLLVKEKFNRMAMCDEFVKIRQIFLRVWIQN